jgi:hypothetical protein
MKRKEKNNQENEAVESNERKLWQFNEIHCYREIFGNNKKYFYFLKKTALDG